MALRYLALLVLLIAIVSGQSQKRLRPISPVKPYPMGVDKVPIASENQKKPWVKNPRV